MRAMAATDEDELDRLQAIATEYAVTIRVLAVVVELLLAEVGEDTIAISDETLERSPDIKAWRDTVRNQVVITVERGE